MAARWKFAIVLMLLLGFALAVFNLLFDVPEPSTPMEQDLERSSRAEKTTAKRPDPTLLNPAKEALRVTGMFLAAQVVDRFTEEPVGTFDLVLNGRDRSGRPFEARRETIENREGRFTVPLGGAGTYALMIKAPGYVREHVRDLHIKPGKEQTTLRITLDRVRSLSGRVVDQSTGLPIEGALVVAEALTRSSTYGYEEGASTDEKGRFCFSGLRKTIYKVTACHGDYEEGSIEAEPPDEEILVPLVKLLEFRVYGIALDDKGRAGTGIRITLRSRQVEFDHYALTGEDGRYVTPAVPPGWATIIAEQADLKDESPFEFTKEIREIRLKDRDVEVNFGPKAEHITWRGIFHGWDGKPVSGGRLWAYLQAPLTDPEVLVEIDRKVVCDEEGRFELVKLIRGTYRVHLTFPEKYGPVHSEEDGQKHWRLLEPAYKDYDWGTITFERPGLVEKSIRVSGAVVGGTVVWEHDGEAAKGMLPKVLAMGRSSPWRTYSIRAGYEGRFRLQGLEPGLYGLSVGDSPCTREYHEDVRVEAGQVIEDVRLVLPRTGTLEVHLDGSGDRGLKRFTVKLKNVKEGKTFVMGAYTSLGRGWWYKEYALKYGSWILILEGEELGRIERPFDLLEPGEVALEIRIK